MLDKSYNPKNIEDKIYKMWEEKGCFTAYNNKDKQKFSIILPPPNVTGILHMGHVLDLTMPDSIIRYKRMAGFDTLWVPGMDHAGIATQNVVERMLKNEGKTKEDLGQEKFIETVWDWKNKSGGTISLQFRKLGASLDWSRERFTMDERSSKAVFEMFKKLYNDGLIYKGEYMVNWCPRCKTALADDEIEHKEQDGFIYHIKYKIKDSDEYLEIATTRPETMLGDTAIAVNSEDERYKHLIGKTAILPLVEREIKIISDSYVDLDFGTGAVKITPAHDPNDFEIGKRHNLEFITIFTEEAKINSLGGKYEGLDRFEARKQIIDDLTKLGLFVGKKPHKNSVGRCYRCDTIIEPRVSTQWFVSMKELSKKALEVVRSGQITIEPKKYEKIYYNWLENIRDWCISRQIWWGHRIPAYYTDNNDLIVAIDLEDAKKQAKEKYGYEGSLRQETDVLDTWFSSALWPISTLGWPEKTDDLEAFYPTSALITGADILFFWVARMIMFGIYATNKVPFKKVFLHGLVRDEIGRKLSKSLNNSPDTLKLIEKYGADAIRFSILYNTSISQDVFFNEKMLEMGSNFANKVFNASKFVLSNLEGVSHLDIESIKKDKLQLEDKYILTKLNEASKKINEYMSKYSIELACKQAYEFFKLEFCDWYIEIAKTRVYNNSDEEDKNIAQNVLRYTLDMGLRLLHPFLPFLTEKIYEEVSLDKSILMMQKFPQFNNNLEFQHSINDFDKVKDVVVSVRNIRAEASVSMSKPVEIICKYDGNDSKKVLEENIRILEKLVNVKSVKDSTEVVIPELSGFRLAGLIEVYLPLEEFLDKDQEILKLKKEQEKIQKEYDRVVGKLNNEQFISKAPQNVIEKEKRIQEELKEKLDKISENIKKYM